MSTGSTLSRSLKPKTHHETPLQRIDALEKRLKSVVLQFQDAITKVNQMVQTHGRLIGALTTMQGEDKVFALAEEQTVASLEAESASAQAVVAGHVETGKLKAVATVSPRSVVVTTESDATGKRLAPGKIVMPFGSYDDASQSVLLGREIGDVVETSEGHRLTVLEIYEFVPPTAEQLAQNTESK